MLKVSKHILKKPAGLSTESTRPRITCGLGMQGAKNGFKYSRTAPILRLSADLPGGLENFYTPSVCGYIRQIRRFSSDDAKTGSVLAYTGSTAGAAYFPTTWRSAKGFTEYRAPRPSLSSFCRRQAIAIQQGAACASTVDRRTHDLRRRVSSNVYRGAAEPAFRGVHGLLPVKNGP
jgi:multiple sugar transport system substrate-binding protein